MPMLGYANGHHLGRTCVLYYCKSQCFNVSMSQNFSCNITPHKCFIILMGVHGISMFSFCSLEGLNKKNKVGGHREEHLNPFLPCSLSLYKM